MNTDGRSVCAACYPELYIVFDLSVAILLAIRCERKYAKRASSCVAERTLRGHLHARLNSIDSCSYLNLESAWHNDGYGLRVEKRVDKGIFEAIEYWGGEGGWRRHGSILLSSIGSRS